MAIPHRIIESARWEKTFKVINCYPMTAKSNSQLFFSDEIFIRKRQGYFYLVPDYECYTQEQPDTARTIHFSLHMLISHFHCIPLCKDFSSIKDYKDQDEGKSPASPCCCRPSMIGGVLKGSQHWVPQSCLHPFQPPPTCSSAPPTTKEDATFKVGTTEEEMDCRVLEEAHYTDLHHSLACEAYNNSGVSSLEVKIWSFQMQKPLQILQILNSK